MTSSIFSLLSPPSLEVARRSALGKNIIRTAVILSFVTVLTAADARASCGSMSCPADVSSSERREKGWVRLGYQFEWLDQSRPRIGTRKASAGEIRGHHDELYTVNRLHRVTAAGGITERLSAELQLPFVSRSHAHMHHHEDGDSHEAWGFTGLGDLLVLLQYDAVKSAEPASSVWSVTGGVKFPTGRRHVVNPDGDEAEAGILPGTGSYDFLVGGAWRRSLTAPRTWGGRGDLPVFASAVWRTNGRGPEQYRIGDAYQASAGLVYPLTAALGAAGQVNVLWRDKDAKGNTREEVENTGGDFVFVSPGLECRFAPGWLAAVLVQVPAHQRVNGIQVTSDYNVLTSLSYRFAL